MPFFPSAEVVDAKPLLREREAFPQHLRHDTPAVGKSHSHSISGTIPLLRERKAFPQHLSSFVLLRESSHSRSILDTSQRNGTAAVPYVDHQPGK